MKNDTIVLKLVFVVVLMVAFLGNVYGITYYISPGSTVSQIQNTINNAVSGDTILLRAGTHVINAPLKFKAGIIFRGDFPENGWSYLDASAQSSPVAFIHNYTNLNNLEVSRLHFKNIQIQFLGTTGRVLCKNIKVNQCVFSGIKNTGNFQTAHLMFTHGRNNEVSDCSFYREDPQYFGGALYTFKAHDMTILNSTIDGYFTKGIDVHGLPYNPQDYNNYAKNVTIDGCYIKRIASPYESTGDPDLYEDHAIYTASFLGIYITNNEFHGWSDTGAGGCAKIRNGEGALFANNLCYGSGVLLYVYENRLPLYLKDVVVKDNEIYLDEPWTGPINIYQGVGYYRPVAEGTEEAIRIANNYIYNGSIFLRGFHGYVSSDWNNNTSIDSTGQQGGVFGNRVYKPGAFSILHNMDCAGNTTTSNVELLMLMYDNWLSNEPGADIAPEPNGDNTVNFIDFASLMSSWFLCP